MQEQIERDVARTHPDMHFFSGEGGAAATRRAQMRRALFVFAKLNPGLRYVQASGGRFVLPRPVHKHTDARGCMRRTPCVFAPHAGKQRGPGERSGHTMAAQAMWGLAGAIAPRMHPPSRHSSTSNPFFLPLLLPRLIGRA